MLHIDPSALLTNTGSGLCLLLFFSDLACLLSVFPSCSYEIVIFMLWFIGLQCLELCYVEWVRLMLLMWLL